MYHFMYVCRFIGLQPIKTLLDVMEVKYHGTHFGQLTDVSQITFHSKSVSTQRYSLCGR